MWWTNEGPSFEDHFEKDLGCLNQYLVLGLDVPPQTGCSDDRPLWNATFACADAACAEAYRSEVAQWTPDTMEWKAATMYGFMYYTTAHVLGKAMRPLSLTAGGEPAVHYVNTCESRTRVLWDYSVSVAKDLSTTTEEMEATLRTMGSMMREVWYPYLRGVDLYCTEDLRTNMFVMGFVMMVAVMVLSYVTCCIHRNRPMHK